MTRQELAQKIATKCNLSSRNEAEQIITSIFEEITNALVNRDEVSITGFGKFVTNERAARDGVNPATSQKIHIPATTVAKFKVAKQLKEAVAK